MPIYDILKATWLVRCKAVTRQNYLDDIELDEESIADIVMDENAVASMPRYVKFITYANVGNIYLALVDLVHL
jgi:hypothetical protein